MESNQADPRCLLPGQVWQCRAGSAGRDLAGMPGLPGAPARQEARSGQRRADDRTLGHDSGPESGGDASEAVQKAERAARGPRLGRCRVRLYIYIYILSYKEHFRAYDPVIVWGGFLKQIVAYGP